VDSYNTTNHDKLVALDGRHLLFYIEGKLYGVSLNLVLEIIQVQAITHLPDVAPYIKGLVNLRGKVVPVVDVRLKLKMPERVHDEKTCIIVVDIHGSQIGLIVDSVSEVANVDASKLAIPPSNGHSTNQYLSSIADIDGKIVLNIDFDRFFQEDINTQSN